jgi:hypothetical protein
MHVCGVFVLCTGVTGVEASSETKEVRVKGTASEADVTAAINKTGKKILEGPKTEN